MDDRLEHLEGVCECAFHVDLMLEKCEHRVEKDEPEDDELRDVVLPPLVISLARLLAARFRTRAEATIDDAVDSLSAVKTAAEVAAIIAFLNEALGKKLSEATVADVEKAIKSMYLKSKLGASHEFHIAPQVSDLDRAAQRWMQHAYPWWIGKYHSSVLAKQIDSIARDVIITRGLSGKEAAELIRNQLTRLYGLGTGEKSPVKVPRSFRGQPDLYWNGLASHAAATARVFGRLSAMREADVTTYVFRTVGDERVCPLCQFMEGREFSVASGEKLRDEILETTTPEEYKAVAGWRTEKAARAMFDKGGIDALAMTGLCLPPLHFLCRCDLEAKV